MHTMLNNSIFMLSMLLLSGCINQTTIQNDYVAKRNDCQLQAEREFARQKQAMAAAQINEKMQNAKLVTLFSDCMAEQGWNVATKDKEKPPVNAVDDRAGVGSGIRLGGLPQEPSQAARSAGAIPAQPQRVIPQQNRAYIGR